MLSSSVLGVGGRTLQNQIEGMWICAMVVCVQQDPWKVCRGGGEESLSTKGGGTGWIDPVEELDRLDEEDEEDVVQVGLK